MQVSRRTFLRDVGASAALFTAGCVSTSPTVQTVLLPGAPADVPANPASDPVYAAMYAPVTTEPFPVPGIDLEKMNPAFLRREVAYPSGDAPGTVVIDPSGHYLYYILPGGRAIRYGVGVGKQGFEWSGVATINSKQEWPDWYPPPEMIARRPDLRDQLTQLQSGIGVAGGPRNPLGARAMYLWQGNKDTLYRIHGTIEPYTIGQSVSSGCIRMINQDAIDLYNRIPIGTEVKVLPARVA